MNNIATKLFRKLKKQGYFETAEYYYARFKKQGLTDQEIAESFVLPQRKLTREQEEEGIQMLKEFRAKIFNEMTEEQKNHAELLCEKFKKEDLERKQSS